ncbi:YsnF/AvaK domain-containing protein [Lacicoccus alkaliphilus]|uniref:Conserved domain-containing protein n=1 Tax=Lacicoccus alkaliphilus DSM 16010 TaxID=1123231 RepID=A0A1M7FZ34_9BACL|nr:YsnF/AvaK domain-containing protein [Salinicoccus alkaliphilus]SHM09283.1 conserved domain-containing protein [Salinicoccus alkaliphilus DSM 16010]
MGRIESFTTESAMLDRVEQLRSDGLAEDRMTVISKYGVEDVSPRFAGLNQRTTETDTWGSIVSWFQGDDPNNKVMDTLELTGREKEEYENHLEAGRLLLYIDYDDHSFYRFTDGNESYDYQDPERPRRPAEGDEESIQLRKEELVVDKERQQVGEVVVNKRTDSEVQEFDVPVDREEVTVERRPIEGEPLFEEYSYDDPGDDVDVIRIPITKERIKIVKEHVVTEEVIIRKKIVTENKHISEVVHHEDIDVTEKVDRGEERSNLDKRL